MYYHPKLCKISLRKEICKNKKCRDYHIHVLKIAEVGFQQTPQNIPQPQPQIMVQQTPVPQTISQIQPQVQQNPQPQPPEISQILELLKKVTNKWMY